MPLPLVVDNPLGRHVAMQRVAERVLEKVEAVSQLSMELLACMARGFDVDVTQILSPRNYVPLR